MIAQAQSALVFATLAVVGMAGMLQISWWVAGVGAATLVLLSVFGRPVTTGRVSLPGQDADLAHALASVLNGTTFAGAAFILGRSAAWAWGL